MLNSGASHATAGGMGRNGNGRTIGGPGAVYAVADASQLTMDSGQSGALTCSSGSAGPSLVSFAEPLAGGIVLLIANQLNVGSSGAITASPTTRRATYRLRAATCSCVAARCRSGPCITAVGVVVPGTDGTLAAGDGYIVVSGTAAVRGARSCA